ncbi:MAG: metallophosphoesterase [Anaerolineae bacterium]|nr:metallophosphoesterase [Anaerolineae bacterium]
MKQKDGRISRRRFIKWACAAVVLGLVPSYPVFIERYIIVVNRYRILVPNLPEAFSGFRIVHLTDLHYGKLVPLGVIRYVVSKANQIARDLVVCTGDYVHERRTTDEIDRVWPLLADLTAPAGVYATLGNHDHWADTDRSQYWLDKTGQNLRHRTVSIAKGGQRVWFSGAGDLYEDHVNLDRLLADIPDGDCRIVLAHNPDTADTPFSARVDLMLSGHTHGGQINIPFVGPPVLPVKNKTYSSGLKFSPRGMPVFISRGIGWAVYPVRFNCLPEIAVLELIPKRSQKRTWGLLV